MPQAGSPFVLVVVAVVVAAVTASAQAPVLKTLLPITLFGGQRCTAKGNAQFGVGGILLGAGIGTVL